MTATGSGDAPATVAAPVRLRYDVFAAKTKAKGAETDEARAALVGVDRVTVWRWRTGRLTPSLDTAIRLAETLDSTVDELFERAA